MVLCMGEISTTARVDIPKIARQVIIDIGYDRAKYGFDGHTCAVLTSIDEQSPDIAMGVNEVFEYREENNEDDVSSQMVQAIRVSCSVMPAMRLPELMLLPISLAHKLSLKQYRE